MANSLFDTVINRRNTDSLKHDFAAERGMPDGLLPLWVADMDFQTPEPVRKALAGAADFGVFGYSAPRMDYYEIVTNWFSSRFNFTPKREWTVTTPGVVFALAMAVRAFTAPGEGVLIQRPVYYPFTEVITDNDRQIVNSPLVLDETTGRYGVDLADFERKLTEHRVRLFILCSPHNPVGRVWTPAELRAMGEICLRHDCIVVADEIHCDFTFSDHGHTVFATLGEAFRDNCLICTSPSKSFNLAGLQISNIFIANPRLRSLFRREIARSGYSQPGQMGIIACKAAYGEGGPWLASLLEYLRGNLAFLRDRLSADLPAIKLIEPDGTYLIWLDFRALIGNRKEADALLVKQAGLWLDDGEMFGPEGSGFQRINIACPRSVLEEAMDRLAGALS